MKLAYLIAPFLACAAAASADTVFTFAPSPTTVTTGQDFTLDLFASTGAMYAFQGDLSFSPGLLQVTDIVGEGDFAGIYGFDPIDNLNGTVTNLYASWAGPGGSSGADILVARIFLTALQPGPATVSFSPSLVVTNPDTFDIDPNLTSTPAAVTVVPTPEPSTLSLAALAIAAALVLLFRNPISFP